LQAVLEDLGSVVCEDAQRRFRRLAAGSTSARVNDAERAPWFRSEVTPGASASIGFPSLNQQRNGVIMGLTARALIGNRAVPVKPVAFECGKDFVCRPGLLTWRIDVFNTKQPLTAVCARVEITRDSG
jgi:hypothetical protein